MALQIFWGWLIVKVLYKLITDGHAEDNRSDDEEEEEGDDEDGGVKRASNKKSATKGKKRE